MTTFTTIHIVFVVLHFLLLWWWLVVYVFRCSFVGCWLSVVCCLSTNCNYFVAVSP